MMYDITNLLKQLRTEKGPALERVKQLLNKIQEQDHAE